MTKKWGAAFIGIVIVSMMAAGCGMNSSGGDSATMTSSPDTPSSAVKSKISNDPVTVSIVMHEGYLDDARIQKYIIEPVKKKHPNITIDFKQTSKGNTFTDLVARNEIPDIIIESTVNMGILQQLGLAYNMEDLIKEHNFDLSRYRKGTVEVLRALNPKKEINFLPYNRAYHVLYYNKDIFDKFAAPYPKDGMTWEDARELAKKVTRMDGGVQYRGLEPNVLSRTASQLSLQYIDPKTSRSALNSASWNSFLQTMLSIYEIPGNEGYVVHGAAQNEFLKDRRLAMLAINNMLNTMEKVTDMSWDLTTFPTFKEAPGIEPEFAGHAMAITSTSPHKDAAMDVIGTVTSDEVQLDIAKDGLMVPFQDPKFEQAFAANLPGLKGKNVKAPFKTSPAVPVYESPTWPQERNMVMGAFTQLEKNRDKDMNTFLRETEEKMNQMIDTAQTK